MLAKPSFVSFFSLILAIIVAGGLAGLIFPITPARAFTIYTVTRTDDPEPDSCLSTDCSLREAIRAANTEPGTDLIVLPAGIYILSRPGDKDNVAFFGDLDITDNLTLQGAGAASTVIDGNGSVTRDRVIEITAGVTAHISGVTIRRGFSSVFSGGGIFNAGSLTLILSQVISNTVNNNGGGIANQGTLVISQSLVMSNTGNPPTYGFGGGLYNEGQLTLVESTVSGNENRLGGGLDSGPLATATLLNSTVSGNRASENGGGINNRGAGVLNLFNVTLTANRLDMVTDNLAWNGGGLKIGLNSTVNTRNTLIEDNQKTGVLFDPINDDCKGILTSAGYNLIGTTAGCIITGDTTGNLTDQLPQLGPLADNGGPTLTHALNPGSPALDAGNPAGCTDNAGNGLTTDQRGYARSVDGDGANGPRCDIGAFESEARVPAPQTQLIYLPILLK
ncbi:MAG: CSLREA domain-containing protein [Anaerolineae bacterium]|nr:CSLREA domain-containing protein [Anaerolineae bacterium]